MTDDANFDPKLEGLNLDDPVRRAQFVGHLDLMKAAWNFLETAVRDGDLRAACGLVPECQQLANPDPRATFES